MYVVECVEPSPNAFATTLFIVLFSLLECFLFYFELLKFFHSPSTSSLLRCLEDFHWKHRRDVKSCYEEKWNFTISCFSLFHLQRPIDKFFEGEMPNDQVNKEKHWNLGAAKKSSRNWFSCFGKRKKLSSALMIKVEALTGLRSHVRCKNLWHWNLDKFLLFVFHAFFGCALLPGLRSLFGGRFSYALQSLEPHEICFRFSFFGTSRGFCWISFEHCLRWNIDRALL